MLPLRWLPAAVALVVPAVALAGPHDGLPPLFEDVTQEAGLGYLQHQPPAPPACVVGMFACDVDRMTGGAAVADVDADGWPDLFVTRLDAPDILFRNRATAASRT